MGVNYPYMRTILIRKLDDTLKARLRVQAARNGTEPARD